MKRARHKYRNTPTVRNGRRYASKAEARYAAFLDYQPDVIGVLEQVPFRFTCGTKYVADFLVFYNTGEARLIDIKGHPTPEFKIKQRLMATEYPWIPLEVIAAKDVP